MNSTHRPRFGSPERPRSRLAARHSACLFELDGVLPQRPAALLRRGGDVRQLLRTGRLCPSAVLPFDPIRTTRDTQGGPAATASAVPRTRGIRPTPRRRRSRRREDTRVPRADPPAGSSRMRFRAVLAGRTEPGCAGRDRGSSLPAKLPCRPRSCGLTDLLRCGRRRRAGGRSTSAGRPRPDTFLRGRCVGSTGDGRSSNTRSRASPPPRRRPSARRWASNDGSRRRASSRRTDLVVSDVASCWAPMSAGPASRRALVVARDRPRPRRASPGKMSPMISPRKRQHLAARKP